MKTAGLIGGLILAGLLLCGCRQEIDPQTSAAAPAPETRSVMWLTDYDAALQQASIENKYILINISGMQWCHYCQALDREVFSQPEFIDYAAKNLICIQLDFDSFGRSTTPQFAARHEELLPRFMIEGFPTVIIMDPQGKAIARDGYRFGGAKPYVEMIQNLIAETSGK